MEKKNNTLNYFIWFLIILIIVVGAWIISEGKLKSNSGTPYTVYNGYLIYELRDEKSLRYLVEAVANDVKYNHYFKNYPSDLLNLSYEKRIKEKVLYKDLGNSIKKDKIYFSYDPEMDGVEVLTAGTIIQILGNSNAGIFKIPVVISVSEDNNNPDFPIKTCEDATKEQGVILLKYGEPKIYSEGECVIVQGNNIEEFKKNNDLLGYMLLGVI